MLPLLRDFLAAPVSARTWKATAYLLVALVAGTVWFGVAVAGAFTLGALALLALGAGVWHWGAGLERRLLSVLLGLKIAPVDRPLPQGSFWARFWARLGDAAIWKEAAYLVLLLPLAIVWCTVAISLWALTLALMAAPVYYQALPERRPRLDGDADRFGPFFSFDRDGVYDVLVDTWWKAALATAIGVLSALVTAQVIRGMARVHGLIAASLLGASPAAAMRRRMRELEHTRARALGSAEAERRRIERDLHDGAQARLMALAVDLGRAREKFPADPEGAQALVEHAHAEAKATIAELRNLARGIHPAVLTDRGLDAALSALAGRSPVPVRIDVCLAERPAPEIESIAYFAAAEALTNVAKHAGATRAAVVVRRAGELLVIEVSDDGIRGAQARAGGGLAGLADRAAAVDGRLSVSSPAGGPTTVRLELPCGS